MRGLHLFTVVVAMVAGTSCAAPQPELEAEVWSVQLFGPDKSPLGIVRIEMTAEAPGRSCIDLGPGTRRLGRVLEKPELDGPKIEDTAILAVDGENFEINLSPGWCDSNVVLSGKRVGDRAQGELLFNRMPGYENVGSFDAQRRGPAV